MGLFTETGRYLPWGTVERVRAEGFVASTTLPNWLATSNNDSVPISYELGSPDTTQYMQVNTPLTLNKYVIMSVNDSSGSPANGGIYRNDLIELRLKVEALTFSDSSDKMDFRISVWGNATGSAGASLGCTSEGTYFEGRVGGTASRKYIDYDILQGLEYSRPRDIEFITRPDRWVLLRSNGYVVAAHQFTPAQMTLGQVNPKLVMIQRLGGTVRWMRFGQLTLTLCHS